MQSSEKTKLVDLNELLTCILCKGYFIDATTIVECLHSFCRTCIVRYLQFNKFCPSCEVQVHKTRPLLNIRSDQTLQDIVYKLVPGLFKDEMKRRRTFYQQNVLASCFPSSSEKRGDIWGCDRLIFTPEDVISVSLEYSPLNDQLPLNLQTNMISLEKNKVKQYYKRYFNCPGTLKVCHLKKLLQAKYGLMGSTKKVDILYMHDLLKDQYTLVDLAYIYSWKRSEPLRLFFKITPETPKRALSAVSETPILHSLLTPFSPSTISSSMAATPSSCHPPPPSSPQMAQEPHDVRRQEPNTIREPHHIQEKKTNDTQGHETKHIKAGHKPPGFLPLRRQEPNTIMEPHHIREKKTNDTQSHETKHIKAGHKPPGLETSPATIRSGQGAGAIAAALPQPNGTRDRKVVPTETMPSLSNAKVRISGGQESNRHSIDLPSVPAIIIPKTSGKINGVLADRTVSEGNLKRVEKKSVGTAPTVLTPGNAQSKFGQEDQFAKMNSTFSTTPKLKSVLKRDASNNDISSPITADSKKRFSMDSQLSKDTISPLSNGFKSSKKRVTFSVNLVQDSQGMKRKGPDYFEDESTFKIEPVKGTAISGMVHMRKKVLSHKSS